MQSSLSTGAVNVTSSRDWSGSAAVLDLVDDGIEILPQRRATVRVLDVVVSLLILLATLPLIIGIGLAVRLTGSGPIFFRQERSGRDGERFMIVKFRTMVPDATARLEELLSEDVDLRRDFDEKAKLQFDPRISAVGNILRPTGLDELPQLWNVLRGQMSMVGPRPLSIGEERRYGPYSPLVWSVKPGITGAWQIGGRNDITYAERVAIDVEYVRSRSLRGDVRLLGRTIKQFLTGRLRGGY